MDCYRKRRTQFQEKLEVDRAIRALNNDRQESALRRRAARDEETVDPGLREYLGTMPEEVFVVLCMAFFAGMAYWQLSPFYPSFLHRKGIDRVYVGIMLSVYAFCFLGAAYYTGNNLLKYTSRLNGCFIGGTFIVINLMGIGSLEYFESKHAILTGSFLFQVVGGIGNGVNIASTMALLSSYKDNRDEFIGYFELIAGLSALVGPLLGSMCFWFFGFKGPFLVIGGFYISIIFLFSFRKKRLEKKISRLIQQSQRQRMEDSDSLIGSRQLTFCDILQVTRSAFGFMVQFIIYLSMSFNTPLISNHLSRVGYSPMFTGFSMASVSIAYMASMPLVFKLLQTMSRRGVILIGLILITVGMLVTGLDKVYNFENPGVFTLIGLAIYGFGFAMISIPVMPEILEGIESSDEIVDDYDEQQLFNSCAGWFVVCEAIGETLGPLSSSLLEKRIDFRPTQKALAIALGIFIFTYVLSCDPITFFKRTRAQKKEEHEELKK